MVNGELLKKQIQQFKLGKDAAADYYKEKYFFKVFFSKHPDVADAYGGVDPETALMQLPGQVNDERSWRSSLSNVKEHYSDSDVPLYNFIKTKDAWLLTMQKYAGGINAEQKKEWEELFTKAFSDMKKWGWI
uniref:GLOBIN domain-containing protein n=1 Tax=Meloidogyne hapla TaxID=6305 RepID=A0A1I8B7T7_MELHA